MKKKAKTNQLFIFADKSESLEGPPFLAVKEGCKNMADQIFNAGIFEKVHFVWYNHLIQPSVHTDRYSFQQVIRNENVAGGTNFNNCFDYLTQEIQKLDDNTNVQIMFLTDGDGQCNGKEQFRQYLSNEESVRGIISTIYCLGVTPNHDANLLNYLAQSGSNMGNFIYIETKDIMEYLMNNTITDHDLNLKMKNSFDQCLKMAIEEINLQEVIMLKAKNDSFKTMRIPYKSELQYENDEDEDIMTGQLKWNKMVMSASALMLEKDLLSNQFTI